MFEVNRGNSLFRIFTSAAMLVALAACGGGGGGGGTTTAPPPTGGVPQLNYYTLGGTVSGLVGSGLVLQNGSMSSVSISANGAFTFPGTLIGGASYNVTVKTQPGTPAQTCKIVGGAGTISANVTGIQVTCGSAISGTISGLAVTATLQNNGADDLSVGTDGAFTFAAIVPTGSIYDVTVRNAYQVCNVANGSGTAGANVSNVAINCSSSVGGTVTGLKGSGLVLRNNGGDDLAVSAAGAFTFATTVATNGAYDVTVAVNPGAPAQTCTVVNLTGKGTAWKNISNVEVNCKDGQWTWLGGATAIQNQGNYGTRGVAAATNLPPARSNAATWTDASGNFWVFGGTGFGGTYSYLNDLWKYEPANGMWTWVSGSNSYDQLGVYGTMGTAAAANAPGGRFGATAWTGLNGELWLFGGQGSDSVNVGISLNDVWKYNIATGMWTWVKGQKAWVTNKGTYGTKGTAAAANTPGIRSSGGGWTDASGNLWLFGGYGFDSVATTTTQGVLNDLWKFNPTTAQWAWMSGSAQVNQWGVYGQKGVAAAGNTPGGRGRYVAWTFAGDFWFYSGHGYGGNTLQQGGYMGDLWKFSPASGQWTWVGGSQDHSVAANYGTLGVAAASNDPGERATALGWADANGNLWLFGGYRIGGSAQDLWKYSVSTGLWTWVGGNDYYGQQSTRYGALAAPGMGVMGRRSGSASGWVDGTGQLWLFGGAGPLYTGTATSEPDGVLNDLWRYTP
jgi:hypothetical protein